MKSITIHTDDGQIIRFEDRDVHWSTRFGKTFILRIDDVDDLLRKEMARRSVTEPDERQTL